MQLFSKCALPSSCHPLPLLLRGIASVLKFVLGTFLNSFKALVPYASSPQNTLYALPVSSSQKWNHSEFLLVLFNIPYFLLFTTYLTFRRVTTCHCNVLVIVIIWCCMTLQHIIYIMWHHYYSYFLSLMDFGVFPGHLWNPVLNIFRHICWGTCTSVSRGSILGCNSWVIGRTYLQIH